jgi:hypothetical protein
MRVPQYHTWNDSGLANITNTATTVPRLCKGSATPIDGVNIGPTDYHHEQIVR